MLGVGDNKIDRTAQVGVAQVVQSARGDGVAAGAATAQPATASPVIAASTFDTRLGKIFDPGNALGDVGDVFAWTSHSSPSLRNCPPIFILRMRKPGFDPPMMLKTQMFGANLYPSGPGTSRAAGRHRLRRGLRSRRTAGGVVRLRPHHSHLGRQGAERGQENRPAGSRRVPGVRAGRQDAGLGRRGPDGAAVGAAALTERTAGGAPLSTPPSSRNGAWQIGPATIPSPPPSRTPERCRPQRPDRQARSRSVRTLAGPVACSGG